MHGADTKEQILNAAEELFARHGYAGTSMRAITKAAGVNLAAVNYHFGTKEKLLSAVVLRRVDPISQARLHSLDELESAAAGEPLPLESVLRAFIIPVFSIGAAGGKPGSEAFLRLIGRLYSEPVESLTAILAERLGEVARRFSAAFGRTLPELALVDLVWRMEFVIGMLCHILMAGDRLALLTGGVCDMSDVDELTDRLVEFAAAGMRNERGRHN